MRISMLTTTFPKFRGDSHGPWILKIADSLVADGYSVQVFAPSAKDLQATHVFSPIEVIRFRYCFKPLEQVAYGANIPTNVQTNPIAKFAFPFFVGGFFVAAIRSLYRADRLHAQFGYSGVFVAVAQALFRNQTPLVVSFYGRDVAQSFKYPRLYGFVFRRATKILVLSEDMKRHLIQAGCQADKISVHHLGVDLSQFQQSIVRDKRVDDPTIMLIVANFVKKKGIPLAIKAFAELMKDPHFAVRPIILKLVGQGPEEAALKALVAQYHLQDKVVFVNNYLSDNPRQVVIDAMREADLFILPSEPIKHDYGGTPVVLMEASAMKLPVITTDDAGNGEIILHEKTGLVFASHDLAALKAAMITLLDDPPRRRSYGEAGALHIAAEFNHAVQMEKLKRLYVQIKSIS